MSEKLQLHSYWRSSAAYRVRIGLNLKSLPYQTLPVHLVRDGGEQHSQRFRATNPQELVPVLQHGQRCLRQSLAILEYLDETWPTPPLLPNLARERQRVREVALAIACEVHPLNNLRVLQYLENTWELDKDQRDAWVQHWVEGGFAAVEALLADNPATGAYCEGDRPTIADCCLVPQVYNARRFGVDVERYPTIARVNQACLALPAFDDARPENQPDAPPPT